MRDESMNAHSSGSISRKYDSVAKSTRGEKQVESMRNSSVQPPRNDGSYARASVATTGTRTHMGIPLLTVTVVLHSSYNSHVQVSAFPSASLPRRIYLSPAMSTVNRGEKPVARCREGPGRVANSENPTNENRNDNKSRGGGSEGTAARAFSPEVAPRPGAIR